MVVRRLALPACVLLLFALPGVQADPVVAVDVHGNPEDAQESCHSVRAASLRLLDGCANLGVLAPLVPPLSLALGESDPVVAADREDDAEVVCFHTTPSTLEPLCVNEAFLLGED